MEVIVDADDRRDASPWVPISSPRELKLLGKLVEEVNELGSAIARCIIQGVDEAEPVTGKINRAWLEDELADVLAGICLVVEHYKLDEGRMKVRTARKIEHLSQWHGMLPL